MLYNFKIASRRRLFCSCQQCSASRLAPTKTREWVFFRHSYDKIWWHHDVVGWSMDRAWWQRSTRLLWQGANITGATLSLRGGCSWRISCRPWGQIPDICGHAGFITAHSHWSRESSVPVPSSKVVVTAKCVQKNGIRTSAMCKQMLWTRRPEPNVSNWARVHQKGLVCLLELYYLNNWLSKLEEGKLEIDFLRCRWKHRYNIALFTYR